MHEHYHFSHPSLRKLEEVIIKLEPLADQDGLVGFLCNVDNAKTLAGFAKELADAVTDYQARVASPTAASYKHLVRYQYSKQCMRGQGTSMMIPRTSVVIPRTC